MTVPLARKLEELLGTKFLVGMEGTIGIITKITMKLVPKPQAKKTIIALYDDILAAGRTVSAIVSRGDIKKEHMEV